MANLTMSQLQWLHLVEDYIKENPAVAPYVTEYASKGLEQHISELQQAKGNIETCVVQLLTDNPKLKKTTQELVWQKITNAKKFLSFNYDFYKNHLNQEGK